MKKVELRLLGNDSIISFDVESVFIDDDKIILYLENDNIFEVSVEVIVYITYYID